MANQIQLITCQACAIATHNWNWVLLEVGGKAVVDMRLCQRCTSNVQDAARRTIKEAAV